MPRAIVEHTTQVIYLNDNEMAVLKPDSFRTMTIDDIDVSPVISQLENKLEEYELGDYEHYMLKEIFEQPHAVRNCLRGRVEPREGRIVLGGLANHARDLVKASRFILTGQGTAWHAGLVGDYLMEDLAKVVTECTYASEFRYRNPIVEENTVRRRDQPVRRNRRHARRPARSEGEGRAGARRGQRRRQHHRPRNRRAASTCTPARKSASPRTKAFTCQCVVADDARALHRPPQVHEPGAVRRR